jgi:hypothetical protein
MYFRRKVAGGRVYLQIAASRRGGGQVRQRVIATLGRLDELEASATRARTDKVVRAVVLADRRRTCR